MDGGAWLYFQGRMHHLPLRELRVFQDSVLPQEVEYDIYSMPLPASPGFLERMERGRSPIPVEERGAPLAPSQDPPHSGGACLSPGRSPSRSETGGDERASPFGASPVRDEDISHRQSHRFCPDRIRSVAYLPRGALVLMFRTLILSPLLSLLPPRPVPLIGMAPSQRSSWGIFAVNAVSTARWLDPMYFAFPDLNK